MEAFSFTKDRWLGTHIDPEELPADPAEFLQRLEQTLTVIKESGGEKIWLRVPKEKAEIIPAAISFGFTFHHCREDFLVLTFKIIPQAHIPSYATHYIGVGGAVINANRELLVVIERFRKDPSKRPFKLPGGMVEEGEHLIDAVRREIREETGVETRFVKMAGFRHWHEFRFGKSDIYFVCQLEPVSEEIRVDATEIEEARWMPVDEYLEHETVNTFNKHALRAVLENTGLPFSEIEGYMEKGAYEFFI